MKKLFNTLKYSFSIIGAVIGAGFITGKEIIQFFYGRNPFLSISIFFLLLFGLTYILLKKELNASGAFLQVGNYIIYLFNLLIMASMLSAVDSLAETLLGISKNIPVFSILLIIISSLVSLNGLEKISIVNTILVLASLVVFFGIILLNTGNISNVKLNNSGIYKVASYTSMNIFLAQPFIFKIKKEKKNFSPFGVALIVSIILSVAIFFFLKVIEPDALCVDIPIILLVNSNKYLYYLTAFIILVSIFTTLLAVQFPYLSVYKNNNYAVFVGATLAAFVISRVGFSAIVEKIYPMMAIVSLIYYSLFIATALFSFLKKQPNNTLARLKHKEL